MKNTCRNTPIPLVASFAGWKGIPWLGWAHNSLSPLLVLHDDHIRYRVIRTRSMPYHVIAGVDYRTAIATTNVVITFTDSITSFAANTAARPSRARSSACSPTRVVRYRHARRN